MVRRFYTPFSRVLKGDVPGHAFHGNQYEAVGGEINWVDDDGKPKPSPIPFFQQNLKEFYESGGKVERYDSQNKVDALLAEVREKLHPGEAKDVVDEAHTPEERKAQGIRFIEEAVREHLGHITVLGKDSQLLVARDKDGNIVSAVNVEPLQSNDGEKLSIGYLGSTKNAHGAATALEEQVAQLAAEKGIGVTSVPTVDSRPYHKKIGRSFNYRGASYWTPEECKAIASLPNPDVKVTKGDVPGHIFHGNQYGAGEASSDLRALADRAEKAPVRQRISSGQDAIGRTWNKGNAGYGYKVSEKVASANREIARTARDLADKIDANPKTAAEHIQDIRNAGQQSKNEGMRHLMADSFSTGFANAEHGDLLTKIADHLQGKMKEAQSAQPTDSVGQVQSGFEAKPTNLTPSGHRPLSNIASEIIKDWSSQKGGVNFGAKPYLEAMRGLYDIKDKYGLDSAKSIVNYFLANSSGWKGDKAKEVKAELKAIMKKTPGY